MQHCWERNVDSRRITDVLFIASVLAWSGAVGWHYNTRVRLPEDDGTDAFIRQLFDDSALRRRRWSILSPRFFTAGAMTECGDYSMTVTAPGPDEREVVSELNVDKVFKIHAVTRARYHRDKGLLSFSGRGSIDEQTVWFAAIPQGDLIEIRITREGTIVHEKLIEKRDLPAGFSPFLPMPGLQVGDSWKVATVSFFDSTVARDRVVVTEEDMLEHGGKSVLAKVVACEGREDVRAWYDEHGEVLRADVRYLRLKLRLVLQSRDLSTASSAMETAK